jgi:hypothetical protein
MDIIKLGLVCSREREAVLDLSHEDQVRSISVPVCFASADSRLYSLESWSDKCEPTVG